MKKTSNGWVSNNFSTHELKCSCCGENRIDPQALSALQKLRDIYDKPMILTSAYRCKNHPEEVHKTAVGSHVKGIAFDIKCHPRDIAEIVSIAYPLGFRGFGYAKSFLHIDFRPTKGGWFYS